jgi:hypothetical protein
MTGYDVVLELALSTDVPTVVVPMRDVDNEPMLFYTAFSGSPRWLDLCRENPVGTAITCCASAIENGEQLGYSRVAP